MKSRQAKFKEDGFLVLDGFHTPASCDALMKRGQELAASFDFKGHPSVFQTDQQTRTSDDYFLDSGDKISFFFEKDAFDQQGKLKGDLFHSLNKVGHALHDLDPVFESFSRSPQLKQLALDLGLDDFLIIQSMLILKHARIGGVVDVHQDSTFLYTEPDTCVGFWFALEDATKENGCLWAMPGGHRTTLRSWFKRKAGGGTEFVTFDPAPLSMEGMVPLEVRKGTCIVLHGLLPHYSLPNTSGRSRQAYAIHAIDGKARYPEENWLRRDMSGLKGF
ncbi:MAG: phytanoyl-CoA dioxygenase family protein [Cyclobacteriaceae bacterium]|nr:phytanoyl-CoA dioxygenase family protein [Cyclobacteriaceae bacterium]